jgi:energy-coupling factor transporter ATP-binding protein EcfA2
MNDFQGGPHTGEARETAPTSGPAPDTVAKAKTETKTRQTAPKPRIYTTDNPGVLNVGASLGVAAKPRTRPTPATAGEAPAASTIAALKIDAVEPPASITADEALDASTTSTPALGASVAVGAAPTASTITILTSIGPPTLGKRFKLEPDGSLTKTTFASIWKAKALMAEIPTAKAMLAVLEQVTQSSNQALVLNGFKNGIVGQPFSIMTKDELARLLGEPVGDEGVYNVEDSELIAARLKRSVSPSAWILFDADNPPGMPAEWASLDIGERLKLLEPVLPGVSACERVECLSSSARVIKTGAKTSPRATHAFVLVSHPERIGVMREYLKIATVIAGLSFPSPRYSRSEPGKVISHEHRTLNDLAVWVLARIVFEAKPDVSEAPGYAVISAGARIVNSGAGVLDIGSIKLPDAAALTHYEKSTGHVVSFSAKSGNLTVVARNVLKGDTEIESDGVFKPLSEWLAGMTVGEKLRCETPFRASESEAAFIVKNSDTEAMLFDSGTGTTYPFSTFPDDIATLDLPEDDEPSKKAADARHGGTRSNDADRLLALVETLGWKVWREEKNREPMVTTEPGAHFPLRSKSAIHALLRAREKARLKPNVAPKDMAPRVIAHLEARCAAPDAPCWPGALRTARGASGAILIDRGTKDFSAYRVTEAGVEVVNAATVERENVRFLRSGGARPFEEADLNATFPEAAAELAKLMSFTYPEDVWVLAGQLLSSWIPDESYSMFLFVGATGAGKTSAARETKNIIDPETGEVAFGDTDKNKSIHDLFVSASKRRVFTQDNVGSISNEMSNAYCVIASGGHEGKRVLYSDSDETLLFAHCVLVLTTTKDNLLRHSDLLDRGSFFELKTQKTNIGDTAFKARANAVRPRIVGGLLNGLAEILPIYDPERNGDDSRMAATVGALRAIDTLFSPPGGAEAAYREMRARAAGANVEAKPFIIAVLRAVADAPLSADGAKREWRGSATDLLAEANARREWSSPNRNAPEWPGDATRAVKTLNADQRVLARLKIEFTTGKTNGVRWISLSGPIHALAAYTVAKSAKVAAAQASFPKDEDEDKG